MSCLSCSVGMESCSMLSSADMRPVPCLLTSICSAVAGSEQLERDACRWRETGQDSNARVTLPFGRALDLWVMSPAGPANSPFRQPSLLHTGPLRTSILFNANRPQACPVRLKVRHGGLLTCVPQIGRTLSVRFVPLIMRHLG